MASGPPNGSPAVFRNDVVLVAFTGGISETQKTAALSSIGATEIKQIGVGVHVLGVAPGSVEGVIKSLKARGDVRYAEPDIQQSLASSSLPNDTYVPLQWAVQNTGQTVNGTTGTAGADERALAAWSVTTGTSSVVVAVLDTGVQYSHPDLASNIWNNPGGIGGCAAGTHGYNVLSSNCDPMDDDLGYGGHGTHVAGIIGAVGNNGAGVAGVNWTSSIMVLKWVSANDVGFTSDLITAMDWVINAKKAGVNVRVVNDSATWAGTAVSQALSDEIDLLGSNDILFVTAAGNTAENNDTTPRYPCSYNRPTMLCVGGTDQDDNFWSSSNFGTTTVQLAAPASNIGSTLETSNYGFNTGDSMASPQVAGTAALLLSLGYQSVANLRSAILNSVDVLPSLASFVSTSGRLNVCKAIPGCVSGTTATPANTGLPAVAGLPAFGAILGASTGIWTGLPTRYSYQWYRCNNTGANCVIISGATSVNYAVLASADVGSTLRVTVTAINGAGGSSSQSPASAVIASATSPFTLTSSIQNGQTISGNVTWQASTVNAPTFVQFYIDGVLSQTAANQPWEYNQDTTATLDTTALSNGTHVLGLRALASDNRTYGFSSASVTVTNALASKKRAQVTSN